MIADSSLFRRCERMYKRHHWWILRVVDHRIPLATRLRQAEDFLRMRSCCLHIGFARKVHGLVSSAKELVETDLWTARLRFTARLLTMRCADIEWRHGRNRHKSNNHGKDSMTQMVARSICEEGKVIQEAVVQEQTLMHQRQLPALPAFVASMDRVSDDLHLLRTPTAWELFRKEIFASAKARSEIINPASAGTFQMVNREFGALTPLKREALERQSDALRGITKENRRQRKFEQAAQRDAIVCHDASAHASLGVASPSRHMAGIVASCRCGRQGSSHLLPSASLNSLEPAAAVLDDDKKALWGIAAANFAKRPQQNVDGNFPLSVPVIHKCLRAKSMIGAHKSFADQVNSMGQAPAGFSFPDNVCYPTACQQICLASSTLDVTRSYLAVLVGLAKFVRQWKPSSVSSSDILLMLQAVADDGSSSVVFCFLCLSLGQAAGQPPEQTFAELKSCSAIADYSDLGGVKLELAFEQFIAPMVRCRSPLNQQTLGGIKCLSEQEMAALFVESSTRMFGGREKCVLNNVTIRKLRFRDIDLKRVEVEGFDGEPFKIEVHAAEVKKGKAKGSSSQAARKLDLCSDFLRPTCRTPAAPAAAAAAREESAAPRDAEHKQVADFMEDLGLDAAAARLVQDDFCKSDGLMTALFSTLPSDVREELQEVLGSEVDEDEIELSNAEEEVLEEDAESADEADEEEEVLEEPEPWPWSVMREAAPWRYVAKASGESLGLLHAVGQDGLKATCKRHRLV